MYADQRCRVMLGVVLLQGAVDSKDALCEKTSFGGGRGVGSGAVVCGGKKGVTEGCKVGLQVQVP